MTEKLNSEYKLKYIKIRNIKTGRNYDITSMVEEFNIYESIFESSITASMMVSDTIGIISALPIMGGEIVTIKFRVFDDQKYITKTFKVYAIQDREIGNDNTQLFYIRMVTLENWIDLNSSISKAFTGNYHSIIQSIVQNELASDKSIDIVAGLYHGDFISPNWSPFEIIQWCLSRMCGGDAQSPFLFFETLDGYILKSLDALYVTKENQAIISYEPKNIDSVDKYNNVDEYGYGELFNKLNMQYGVYGQHITEFDITKKEITTLDQDYSSISTRMDKVKVPFDNENMKRTFRTWQIDQSHINTFTKHHLMNIMDQVTTKMTINGDAEKFRSGDILTFRIPRLQKKTGDGLEPYLYGNFLISSIRHTLDIEDYNCTCEMFKDSLHIPIQ